MRKVVLVCLVAFSVSIFALSGVAQRRGRGRGRGTTPAAAQNREPPNSPRIAQELGGLQWGSTREQVVEHFRRQISARYQPLLRNKGQVEQDRLLQERDREIAQLQGSFVAFNGATNQRRWDTSFVGPEYTHNNNESMLMREDPQNGNREFFFFFNDRLWKRFQARALPPGGRMDFATFISGLEQIFGAGLHRNRENSDQLETVMWQDPTSRLRVVDNSTFYNSFGLIYEERATLARLAELRRNAPTKTQASASARPVAGDPQVGNVEGDQNADIVDRITGKMRRVQNAPGGSGTQGGSSGSSSGGSSGSSGGSTPTPPPSTGGGNDGDPLRGL